MKGDKNILKKKIIKQIALVLMILAFNTLSFINSVYASNINSAHMHSIGDCGELLTYKGVVVKSDYVVYNKDGVNYPAYCLDKTKTGANTTGYTVSVQDSIKDVRLWRIIINGYPYKSIQQLGVANKEEAFVATKQAVYCYIHGNQVSDYAPIGQAGQRTLNAMKKILSDANNSNESKISSTIKIDKSSNKWVQDNIDKNYLSKTYQVEAGANIKNYKITLTKENGQDLGGIKLTDEKNKEKTEFSPNEKFKILIPLKSMREAGNFSLKVDAQIATKPILYGVAPNSTAQDYALTGATYEDGTGSIQDEYFKNDTKIIILKQDAQTKEKMQGVEFELLDENKNRVYNDLKTNQEGKIQVDNLVPGTYYLRETNTKDGYLKYDDLIRVDVKLNEQVTITVNNNKEDRPMIETSKKDIEVTQDVVTSKSEKEAEIVKENTNQTKTTTQENTATYTKESVKQIKTLPVTGM